MATGIFSWSQTAATNSTADSTINYAEGQTPSSLNDSCRALMAIIAKYRDDLAGVKTANTIMTTAGSANAQTLSTNGSIAALTNGWTLTFKVGSSLGNTGACTLAVDSLTAKNIQITSGTNLTGGELIAGRVYTVTYHQPADTWLLHCPPSEAEVYLTSGSISSQASLSLVLTPYTGFRAIRLVVTNLIPQTDAAFMQFLTSTNGGISYDTGGSDYSWAHTYQDDGGTTNILRDDADSRIRVTLEGGNAAGEGAMVDVTVWGQASTSTHTLVTYTSASIDSNGALAHIRGAGRRKSAADVDAIALLANTGNISCNYAFYGLR